MKTALLAFATALRLAPARGFVSLSPGPIQRHQTAKHTHLPPTRRRRDRPSTVDVAHDVGRGAASANAAMASGFFVFSPQEPYVIVVVAASQLLALTWAVYNAAAMAC